MNRRRLLAGAPALFAGPSACTQVLPQRQTATSPQGSVRQYAAEPAEIIQDDRVETFALGTSAQQGAPWTVFLARPSAPPPPAGYPVLYLLDGNSSFPAAWHAQAALMADAAELRAGQIALVGIGYPGNARFDVVRRYYDLTPYTAAEYRGSRSGTLETGGQARFLDFLATDVRRAVAERLPVDGRRQAIFGHSLAGLFALHALYTRPELFQTYAAADPAIWWNGCSVLQEEAGFLAGIRAAGGRLAAPARLLVENSAPRLASVDPRRVAAPGTGAVDSAERLARVPGMTVFYRSFERETHGSMLVPAVRDALVFALDGANAELRRLGG